MTIAAQKINETAFYDIYGILDRYPWLKHSMCPLLELWNLCDEKSQQELIKELFERFTYIDGYQLEKVSNEIYSKTLEWGFSPPNTYISAVADKDEVDGSIAGLQFLKNKFPSTEGWKEDYFYPTITKVAHATRSNDNIILFDDFIGSGKTIIRKTKYLLKTLDERSIKPASIKIITYAAMEFGIERINKEYDIEVFTPIKLKKGLTDFESPDSLQKKKDLIASLDQKLGKRFKKLRIEDHHMGYGESECLFQIQGNNCPNNLFPIFWWPTLENGEKRETLFKRIR